MPKLAQVNFPAPQLWRDFRSSETHLDPPREDGNVASRTHGRGRTHTDPRKACLCEPGHNRITRRI